MRDVTTIKFAKLVDSATIPSGRDEDLGIDFYHYDKRMLTVTLKPHVVYQLPTGIIMAMDEGYGMILKERSSLGSKGIAIRAGVIDSGYRGEVIICLENTTDNDINIDLTKAIAQGVLIPNPKKVIEEYKVEEIMAIDSERGVGGFGSTN
jgi:dUTP pyrophosphatase|nr:MAG TPA: dUTPase [Caudoviricetes sp.]